MNPLHSRTTDINLIASPDRRIFLKGLGVVSTGLVLSTLGGCEQLIQEIDNRPTRRWIGSGSAAVQQDLATYTQAVQRMKQLDTQAVVPATSWANVAAIHGTVQRGFIYCQHGTDHFFDWHRGYLLNFERICQQLTGNPHFGLPYWNWNQNPQVPAAFLDSGSTLFAPRANTSLAGVGAVSSAELDPIFGDSNFITFSQQLEGTPHNTVHTFIGGGQLFGGGGSAADPLFWVHHCMVDYCWYKWNIELGFQNTNDPAWANFVDGHYVDANGNPNQTSAAITTLMPLLSYQYESSAIGSFAAKAKLRKRELQQVEARVRQGANVRLDISSRLHLVDRSAVRVGKTVSLAAGARAEELSAILSAESRHEHVFASIDSADLPVRNDFIVRVFVNLPQANRETPTTDPHYAGSFAFFGTALPASADSTPVHRHQPRFIVSLSAALQRPAVREELNRGNLSLQLVAVPFAGTVELPESEVVLTSVDIITTPIIVTAVQP